MIKVAALILVGAIGLILFAQLSKSLTEEQEQTWTAVGTAFIPLAFFMLAIYG